jgi:chemotaxis protein MotA
MSASKKTLRPDLASFAGITVAVLAIVGGLVLEKGSIKDIAQITSALIVCGGTAGAVLMTSPMKTVRSALQHFKSVFFDLQVDPVTQINEIVTYAAKARKQGIISLEVEADAIADPFLHKAIGLAVDGADIDELKTMMELEISQHEQHAEEAAKVFESGGGYSPTIGIIGAVLGLIQVMKNLENISEVGHGIAVAFVATVYGVALANLILLPAAGKIRARAAEQTKLRELCLEGIVGIVEGSNPKLIRAKLEGYLPEAKERERSQQQQKRLAA